MSKENKNLNEAENSALNIADVRHSAFGWFIRKPIKLINYYNYLKRINKANKDCDYDYPELNWYMRN